MTTHTDQPKRTVADLIKLAQRTLDLSDEALSNALGYDNPAVARLLKDGQINLPVQKAGKLAELAEMKPSEVMRIFLQEKSPELLAAIEECTGPLDLSAGEKRLITALRKSAQGRDPTPVFVDGASIIALVVG